MVNSDKNLQEPAFVGVKTTKIYCFPWCTAPKPKPENVVTFKTRGDAENAGYRACRTCFSALPKDSWADKKSSFILKTPKPFSFDETLAYLSRSANECLFRVEDRKIYKLLHLQASMFVIRIQEGKNDEIELHFEVESPLKKSLRVEAARYVWDWFDFGTDLLPFHQMALEDPILLELIKKYQGFRVIGVNDLFEALSWAIIGQQINLPFAYTLKRNFVEKFGRSVSDKGFTYWLFPQPEDVAGLTSEDLKTLKFTHKKAEYLIDIAQRMVSGDLTKQKLLALGDFKIIQDELMRIRGIGHWTANYVTMRCLRDPAAFPVGDIGLQNALKRILNLNRKPTSEELDELSSNWSGWQAYATFYLWRDLQEAHKVV
jgi:DNA-3-methyladenine glycosylase II